MDPAQQRTRGRRRRAARPRRAPRGKHAGKGRRALCRRRAPGGRPRPSQGGRRGKSPRKHWAAGNAPKLARRLQKVSGLTFPSPGARPARRGASVWQWQGRGAGPAPSRGPRVPGRGRSGGSGAAGPTCAGARGARRPLASRRRRLAVSRFHSGRVLPRCRTRLPAAPLATSVPGDCGAHAPAAPSPPPSRQFLPRHPTPAVTCRWPLRPGTRLLQDTAAPRRPPGACTDARECPGA